uniref:Uncharacterized protein n=1 Tax=Rhizophora mucronata TaxID=61149 RepID=A0A2P2JJ35_RHIMU
MPFSCLLSCLLSADNLSCNFRHGLLPFPLISFHLFQFMTALLEHSSCILLGLGAFKYLD